MEDDEEVTPRARNFQRDTDDEVEPYETPVVLKKPKRRVQEVIEDSEVPVMQLDMHGKNREGPTTHSVRLTSESAIKVCNDQCNVMCTFDNIVPLLAHCQIYWQSGGRADKKASNSISHV